MDDGQAARLTLAELAFAATLGLPGCEPAPGAALRLALALYDALGLEHASARRVARGRFAADDVEVWIAPLHDRRDGRRRWDVALVRLAVPADRWRACGARESCEAACEADLRAANAALRPALAALDPADAAGVARYVARCEEHGASMARTYREVLLARCRQSDDDSP